MIRLLRALTGVLVLLFATTDAWAQATAQINGTVADSSGGVLPGVTVIAIQTETGFRREAVSDETGSYALLNLPVGPYRLEATLAGFRTYAQTGIVVVLHAPEQKRDSTGGVTNAAASCARSRESQSPETSSNLQSPRRSPRSSRTCTE